MFESMLHLLEAIPAAVYAATTASTITLIGLSLQNRGESKRNFERLVHDARQRDREREMTLRRDVYLEAAEAMAQAQEYLAGFANIDAPPQQHEALIKGVGADLNKVHIVGSMATVKAVVEANQFFAQAVADLSIHKLPLRRIAHEIDYQQAVIASASARRDESLASMKEMTRIGGEHVRAWDLQQKIFNDEQNEIDVAFAKREALHRDLAQLHADFIKRCADAGLALGKLVVNANLAIRRELELCLDASEYRQLMQRSHDRIGRAVDELQQSIVDTEAPELASDTPLLGDSEHARRRLCALKRLNVGTELNKQATTPRRTNVSRLHRG